MKKVYFFLISIFFLALGLSEINQAQSLRGIIESGITVANRLTAANIEMVRSNFDILSTTSDIKRTYRVLSAKQTYSIGVFANEGVENLALIVYEPVGNDWVEIARGDSATWREYVSVAPTTTQLYRIDVVANKFSSGYKYGYYNLFIASSTGIGSQKISNFMDATLSEIKTTETQYGYQAMCGEFDILNSSFTAKSMWRNLVGGIEYHLYACFGSGIDDVDLSVYREVGTDWVYQRTREHCQSGTFIDVTPASDGFYRFDVQAHSELRSIKCVFPAVNIDEKAR
jgi:hypothetical protein